jgi:hypothetical protein
MTRPSTTPPTPARTDETANEEGLVSTVLQLSGWSVYVGALLTTTGWAYADRYFASFGLGLSAIDSDLHSSFAIYAIWAARDGWRFVFTALLYVVAALMLAWLWNSSPRFWRPAAGAIIALAMLLSIPGAFKLGQWRADDQVPKLMAEDYATFPRVLIHAKDGSALAAFLKTKNADSSCLRKLFMDKRNLYLYPGYDALSDTIPPVYILPLREIAAIEVVRNPGLCSDQSAPK